MKSSELELIVSHYIANKRSRAAAERRWFVIQSTLEDTISAAATARTPKGKRFGHQRRIPESVLQMSKDVLLKSLPALQSAKTFEELHRVILDKIGDIHGIGELTVYDTAVRIGANGAKLNLAPAVVFLHAGTRIGAKALGLDVSQKFIATKFFLPEFGPLSPAEIEDVLCIYKDRLRRNVNGRNRGCN